VLRSVMAHTPKARIDPVVLKTGVVLIGTGDTSGTDWYWWVG